MNTINVTRIAWILKEIIPVAQWLEHSNASNAMVMGLIPGDWT